jgi:hypothetical protein
MQIQVPADIKEQVPTVVAWASDLTIANHIQYEAAAERLLSIKEYGKKVDAFFKPIKQAADATKKAILDAEKLLTGPLADAERQVKTKLVGFQNEEQRKREAEQRRLQAIADEKARVERQRQQQAAAEARKKADEERQKADEFRKKAEEASAEERRKLLAQANTAERRAGAAEAKEEAAKEEAAAIIAPTVAVSEPSAKVSGISTAKIWKFRIVNPDLIPRNFLVPDEKAIGTVVKALGERANIAGIETYQEDSMRAGRTRQ